MNILLINHYAGSIRHGMEFRPYYMAREWIKQGHQVTIIAASESHLRTSAPAVREPVSEEDIDGIRYIWLKTPAYRGNGIKRVVNMFAFVIRLWRLAGHYARRLQPDAVIASSTYPLDIIPASRIADKAKAKLVFEVHDLWPLSPIELGGISPYHPFMMLLQWAENFAYRRADRVVSMLPKAYTHMVEHGMEAGKFCYVPNGVVLEDWMIRDNLPQEHHDTIAGLKESGKFLVGYAGSHGVANALESFIHSAARLSDLPVVYVLVGQGPDKEQLQTLARRVNAGNVVFLPPVPKTAIPELLSGMDALYIGFRKIPLYRFGISPNKLIDYMMASKPIIHAVEAANDPVAECGCGISIPPEDPDAIAEAVRMLMRISEADRREMGERARRHAVREHDYQILARRFAEVMRQC